jgi:hypothetical protein
MFVFGLKSFNFMLERLIMLWHKVIQMQIFDIGNF